MSDQATHFWVYKSDFVRPIYKLAATREQHNAHENNRLKKLKIFCGHKVEGICILAQRKTKNIEGVYLLIPKKK